MSRSIRLLEGEQSVGSAVRTDSPREPIGSEPIEEPMGTDTIDDDPGNTKKEDLSIRSDPIGLCVATRFSSFSTGDDPYRAVFSNVII